jgi:hypothetical protein
MSGSDFDCGNAFVFGLAEAANILLQRKILYMDAILRPDDARYRWSTNVMRCLASSGAALF